MLTEPVAVTLLYTAALEGRLSLLPHLQTRIRQERATISGVLLLVDLGRSCTPEAWICDSTGGRGMLVAMDAMGYDAFHIGPQDMLYTQPAMVEQLRSVIQTPFAAGPFLAPVHRQDRDLVFAGRLDVLHPAEAPDLVVVLRLGDQPNAEASWQNSRRTLLLDGGWTASEPLLGRLDMVLTAAAPYIEILNHVHLAVSPDLLPDPTMLGVVEFVESEARYAERKRGQSGRTS